MTLRFASLGSGSRGNATLIQSASTCLLLDCGFAAKELEKRCLALGVTADDIDAILVTHEHGDHSKGVGPVARRYQLPVWMTHGTWRSAKFGDLPELKIISTHANGFTVGDIKIRPFTVPHDAREPCQYVFATDNFQLGIVTDLGSITPHVVQSLRNLDALILECNHDRQMLEAGPYPPSLKARVAGNYGHLNNQQSAELLHLIKHDKLQHLVVAHISEKNNTPELARSALLKIACEFEDRLNMFEQDQSSDWYQLM